MTGKRAFLLIQSLLCALAAGWLALAAVGLYLEGAAMQASGELFYYIYTRERVAERLTPIWPLIFMALGMTVSGWILGIRDEGRRPARVEGMTCALAAPQRCGRGARVLRAAALMLALALIAAGIGNGGLEDVMTKANAICMECVGLG